MKTNGLLTKLSIVERDGRSHDTRVHSEDVIAALAAEDRGGAPAAAQEQQHHQHHRRERRYRAYVCRRLHCTTQRNNHERYQSLALYRTGSVYH